MCSRLILQPLLLGFKTILIWRTWARGNPHYDPRARSSLRVNRNLAVDEVQPFANADKSEARFAVGKFGVETFAIVQNLQPDTIAISVSVTTTPCASLCLMTFCKDSCTIR